MSSVRSNDIHQPRIFKPAAAVFTQQSEWVCWATPHWCKASVLTTSAHSPFPSAGATAVYICALQMREEGAHQHSAQGRVAVISAGQHWKLMHTRRTSQCEHQQTTRTQNYVTNLLAQADLPHRLPACAPPLGSHSAGLQAPETPWTCGAAWRNPQLCQPAPTAVSVSCDAPTEGVRVKGGRAMLCTHLALALLLVDLRCIGLI